MIKDFVSQKAQNWEAICTSGGGLRGAFSDALRGVASKKYSRASNRTPVSFRVAVEKRRPPTFVLSSFKILQGIELPVEGTNTA